MYETYTDPNAHEEARQVDAGIDLAGKDDVFHAIVTGPHHHTGCMQMSGPWVETAAFKARFA